MTWRGPTTNKVTNQVPNPVSYGNEMSGMNRPIPGAGFPFKENRALDVRRDKDEIKDFSVKLLDIDTTIFTYLDTVISPTVKDAGRQVKVPINYASPERWKAIRKDGAIRDKQGKIQCPVIAFRRTTMQRNDQMITLNRYLQYPVVKKFSEKNKYDKFSLMNGFAPVKEVYSVAMPDHQIINYDFIVWTEYLEQNNGVVEAINFSTEDYWGDKKRFKFRTSISDFNFETTTDSGQDRVVKSTFSLMVYAYLLPDRYENYKSVVQKAFTPRKVVINFDAVVTDTFQLPKKQSLELYSVPNNFGGTPSKQTESSLPGNGSGQAGVANADHSFVSNFALSALTASYFSPSGSLNVGGFSVSSVAGATGSIVTNIVTGVTEPTNVDVIPIATANAAQWLVSITDGGNNFKASEVMATWNDTLFNYYITEVSQVGTVPVVLSVNNSGGNINLLANPITGTWNIKLIRTMV